MEFFCAMQCNRNKKCIAWCIVDSECWTTKFWISPQDGPDDSNHIKCFTKRRSGNHILKATATGSQFDPNRSPLLFTKGIHNFDWSTTLPLIKSGPNPFMLFEFPSEVSIKTIIIFIGFYEPTFPSDQTEIRLGSTMNGPTDFSQLELVGTLADPKVYETRTFTFDSPKTSKFLAILETDGTKLDLCFLEVFSDDKTH